MDECEFYGEKQDIDLDGLYLDAEWYCSADPRSEALNREVNSAARGIIREDSRLPNFASKPQGVALPQKPRYGALEADFGESPLNAGTSSEAVPEQLPPSGAGLVVAKKRAAPRKPRTTKAPRKAAKPKRATRFF